MHHAHVGHAGQRSVERTARGAALGLLTLVLLVVAPAAANAAEFSVSPVLPTIVSLGSTVSGSIELTNGSEASRIVCNAGDLGPCDPAKGITLVASCATQNSLGCIAADRDVFAFQSPALGAAGSACAGRLFTVAQTEPTYGTVGFRPTGRITLPAGETCRIDFTFTVLRSPTTDAKPAPAARP